MSRTDFYQSIFWFFLMTFMQLQRNLATSHNKSFLVLQTCHHVWCLRRSLLLLLLLLLLLFVVDLSDTDQKWSIIDDYHQVRSAFGFYWTTTPLSSGDETCNEMTQPTGKHERTRTGRRRRRFARSRTYRRRRLIVIVSIRHWRRTIQQRVRSSDTDVSCSLWFIRVVDGRSIFISKKEWKEGRKKGRMKDR